MFQRQTAGRRAMAEFRRRRRVALRDTWRDWVAWLAALAVVITGAFLSDGLGQLVLAGSIGALLTMGLVGWFIGGHVSSLPWMWGATGERHTAAELRRLPPEWQVVHDLPDGRGNWDHVVAGPPGVFLIDSKTFNGPVSADGDGLRSGRFRYGGSFHRGQAVRLKEKLERETGLATWVQAVVAVWADFLEREVEREKVVYLEATRLTDWLESGPSRLSTGELEKIQGWLRRL